ncbi:hypothetical protein LZ31DRAFT_611065 [Colletotrichum somersetense]|nr:hypothetical protein LZ31DRAFT_611065 [Colletotrichum somersetense]
MHRSAILAALASLTAGSLAATVAARAPLPRDNRDCSILDKVPLSSDPNHSEYTFQLDPSVKDQIATATETLGVTFNTIQVDQTCDNIDDARRHNFGGVNITGFGPDTIYTVQTDRCENGKDRSPLFYSITLCVGDGTACSSLDPTLVCGSRVPGEPATRPFCAVAENEGGNPKAVNLTDPMPWSCRICKGTCLNARG